MLRPTPATGTVASLIAFCSVGFLSTPTALAIPDFFKEFNNIYATEEAGEEYNDLLKKAKCYVCHQGKSKKNRNVYGEAYVGLLTKKDKTRNNEEVQKKVVDAIKKVGGMPSDPQDKESPTFDELIAEGKLPGGTLEEAKEEPAKD